MPPFVQSTNWTSLVRQAGRLLTRIGVKQKAPVARVQQVARHIRHTFPSLSTPAHQLEHAYAYAPLPRAQAQSAYTRAQQLHQARRPFTRAARGFRTATNTRRPTIPAPCNVGLGTARNYAYAAGPSSASGTMVSVNVPHVLRALASLLDSDLDKVPKGSVYTAVDMRRLARVAIEVSRAPARSIKSDSDSTVRAFEHYFHPAPAPNVAQAVSVSGAAGAGLLIPSELVTEGFNTTLTIPLAASYHSILELPPNEPYSGSDLGVRKFANLLGGVLTLHQIIHNRASHFVIPLMDKLDSLGVTDPATCEMHISYIDHALPESISLKFVDRSAADVRKLLGESLRSAREGEWWVLTEHYLTADAHELSPAEARQMLEEWDHHSCPAAVDTSQLVMPLIDLDDVPETVWPLSQSREWSAVSTPESLLDDSPDPAASIYTSSCDSLSSSLFAEMLASGLERTMTRSSVGDEILEAEAEAEREWQQL